MTDAFEIMSKLESVLNTSGDVVTSDELMVEFESESTSTTVEDVVINSVELITSVNESLAVSNSVSLINMSGDVVINSVELITSVNGSLADDEL